MSDSNKQEKEMECRAAIRASFDKTPYVEVTDHVRMEERWIPAPDGAKLRTMVFIPEGVEAPYPTIVQRSCYPDSWDTMRVSCEEFAKRGFAMVFQWCRGTGGSEGVWEPNVRDRADGLSLMNELQSLDWVGPMGYMGGSYLSMTGWIISDSVPDKVKTMYLTVYGTERHTSAWHDGLFRQDILTAWAMYNAGHRVEADYFESAEYRPQVQVDEALWGGKLDWYRDWITHPGKNDPYWSEGHWETLHQMPGRLRFPVFIGEGWYDHHLGSMLEGFTTISETAKAHSIFQINPGNHSLKPVLFGHVNQKNAAIDEDEQKLRWFHEILVEEKLPDPAIRYYIIGADEWRTYQEFPPKPTGSKVIYLNNHQLTSKPGVEGQREYDYDPKNPVMSHGAETLFRTYTEIGSLEQPEPDWRPDVLSFVSSPVFEKTTIVGPIEARLWIRSDAPDTCFAVKVMEVFPDGRAFHIRNGITTLAWRNGATEEQSYNGEELEITIRCCDVAWQLQPGSCLRLDITSSDFPEYSVHPNTTTLWSLAKETKIAHQTVLFGEKYPSCITLPLNN